MTFEALLTQELYKITAINNNVYPLCVPEGINAPYICYVMSGGEHNKDLHGYSDSRENDYEINILSSKYSQLKPLEEDVFNTLKKLIGQEASGRKIQDIKIYDPIEKYEESIKLQRANIEFTVFY